MKTAIFDIFIYILFAVLCLAGAKVKKVNGINDLLDRLNNFRGPLAIGIIIGHVVRYENTLLFAFGKEMICSVAFFFFLSAYGMTLSVANNKNYLNRGFIIKKPFYILIIIILISVINIVVDAVIPLDLHYVTNLNIEFALNCVNWYLWELIIFYFVFYVGFKLKKLQTIFIVSMTVALTVFAYKKDFSSEWFTSTIGFPAGIIFAKYPNIIIKFCKSVYAKIIYVILMMVGVSSFLINSDDFYTAVITRNAICLAFIVTLTWISRYLVLANNRVVKLLNKISLELYICQFVWLSFASAIGFSYPIRIIIVLICTFATAIVTHPIFAKVKKKLKQVNI